MRRATTASLLLSCPNIAHAGVRVKRNAPTEREIEWDWICLRELSCQRGIIEDARLSSPPPIAYLVLASWRRVLISCSTSFLPGFDPPAFVFSEISDLNRSREMIRKEKKKSNQMFRCFRDAGREMRTLSLKKFSKTIFRLFNSGHFIAKSLSIKTDKKAGEKRTPS